MGGDERIVETHDRAVTTTLDRIEKNAVLIRMQDGTTGAMLHAGDQMTVVGTFRRDTSRNLELQLHTHSVIADMVQGADNRWRTTVNDGPYGQQKAISASYGDRELDLGATERHPPVARGDLRQTSHGVQRLDDGPDLAVPRVTELGDPRIEHYDAHGELRASAPARSLRSSQ